MSGLLRRSLFQAYHSLTEDAIVDAVQDASVDAKSLHALLGAESQRIVQHRDHQLNLGPIAEQPFFAEDGVVLGDLLLIERLLERLEEDRTFAEWSRVEREL